MCLLSCNIFDEMIELFGNELMAIAYVDLQFRI